MTSQVARAPDQSYDQKPHQQQPYVGQDIMRFFRWMKSHRPGQKALAKKTPARGPTMADFLDSLPYTSFQLLVLAKMSGDPHHPGLVYAVEHYWQFMMEWEQLAKFKPHKIPKVPPPMPQLYIGDFDPGHGKDWVSRLERWWADMRQPEPVSRHVPMGTFQLVDATSQTVQHKSVSKKASMGASRLVKAKPPAERSTRVNRRLSYAPPPAQTEVIPTPRRYSVGNWNNPQSRYEVPSVDEPAYDPYLLQQEYHHYSAEAPIRDVHDEPVSHYTTEEDVYDESHYTSEEYAYDEPWSPYTAEVQGYDMPETPFASEVHGYHVPESRYTGRVQGYDVSGSHYINEDEGYHDDPVTEYTVSDCSVSDYNSDDYQPDSHHPNQAPVERHLYDEPVSHRSSHHTAASGPVAASITSGTSDSTEEFWRQRYLVGSTHDYSAAYRRCSDSVGDAIDGLQVHRRKLEKLLARSQAEVQEAIRHPRPGMESNMQRYARKVEETREKAKYEKERHRRARINWERYLAEIHLRYLEEQS